MPKTILFIHGMFQNAKSWNKWAGYFTEKGFHCIVPSWPDHEGEPAELRADPPATLGELGLAKVTRKMEELINTLPEKPIVIGHSVGGLITQVLANKGLIAMGVPISSVAPNKMMTFDWDFFKNSAVIANPFKGSDPIYQDLEMFHGSFCNTLDDNAAKQAFEETATHDSRNIFRDCLTEDGHVEMDREHPPLLFVSGEEDKIIPHELVEKNTKAYDNQEGILYKLFPNRSHYICNEPGWEEVVEFVHGWIVEADAYVGDEAIVNGEITNEPEDVAEHAFDNASNR
jgi:pimeloyl-ACP methyl ester carboxylesterase